MAKQDILSMVINFFKVTSGMLISRFLLLLISFEMLWIGSILLEQNVVILPIQISTLSLLLGWILWIHYRIFLIMIPLSFISSGKILITLSRSTILSLIHSVPCPHLRYLLFVNPHLSLRMMMMIVFLRSL